MTRVLTAMSDRLLSTVAPKAEAAAYCSPRARSNRQDLWMKIC